MIATMFMILSALLLLFVFGATAYLRRRSVEIAQYERFSNSFFKASKPLLTDDETPDEVLHALAFLNRKIGDRAAAKEFYTLVSQGRMDPLRSQQHPISVVMRKFFARRPELEKSFAEAVGSGILAMTFLSPVYGSRVRLFFASLDTQRARENIVVSFSDNNHSDGTSSDGCLAAA